MQHNTHKFISFVESFQVGVVQIFIFTRDRQFSWKLKIISWPIHYVCILFASFGWKYRSSLISILTKEINVAKH